MQGVSDSSNARRIPLYLLIGASRVTWPGWFYADPDLAESAPGSENLPKKQPFSLSEMPYFGESLTPWHPIFFIPTLQFQPFRHSSTFWSSGKQSAAS